MTADYTVIVNVRQAFGGAVDSDLVEVPRVGVSKDYAFDCPDVNPRIQAILMFQSFRVLDADNIIEVNPNTEGQPTVFGGIPRTIDPSWHANIMLIRAGALRDSDNVLHIEAVESTTPGGVTSVAGFFIDNVVVMFKTAGEGPGRTGSKRTATNG